MSQGKGKRSRSTNDGTVGGVLRTMARAHELVVGRRPGDNATQMRAHYKRKVGDGETQVQLRKSNAKQHDTGKQASTPQVASLPDKIPSIRTSVKTIRLKRLVFLDDKVTEE